MVIGTLLDLLPRIEELAGREAIRSCGEFRTAVLTYSDLWRLICSAASLLSARGLNKGDRILLWGESSPEWVALFWASLALGVEVVPLDASFSHVFAGRVYREAHCKQLFHGSTLSYDGDGIVGCSLQSLHSQPARRLSVTRAQPSDVVEVLFTSGTTGAPRGVVHCHSTLTANLKPFAAEFDRYGWLCRPFQPIRILNLLPLSHLFGQAMGLFIPVLLGGSVAFSASQNPARLVRCIRENRISVLAVVPRQLGQLGANLRESLGAPADSRSKSATWRVLRRWWLNRGYHRALGWKFWALVVGGATLPERWEKFWSSVGILVIQGYGLTEAGPVVSVNHPFRRRKGSIGRVLPGQEIKLSRDGEILVRGDSVSRAYVGGREASGAESEGWLPTGDLGRIDEEGNLFYLGRRADRIVTGEGLNVFPDEVESALQELPEVREAAVVGLERGSSEVVHACLILEKGVSTELPDIVGRANRRLESHQRIRSWSLWPGAEFPRTSSTLKLRRNEIAEAVKAARSGDATPGAGIAPEETFESWLRARIPGGASDQERLDQDLGLSSLDRIELLSRLEGWRGHALDESTFIGLQTVGDFRRWLESPREVVRDGCTELIFPRWTRRTPMRALRWVLRESLILPLFRHFLSLSIEERGIPEGLGTGPVLLVANHQSHLDAIAILAALPRALRSRLAPAMHWERFSAYFSSQPQRLADRCNMGLQYVLACLLFNAYPISQDPGRFREVLEYTGELVDEGLCPLIFPEGRRSPDGALMPFRAGAVLMAERLGLPILPVLLAGLHEVMPVGARWPRKGEVRVCFGELFEIQPGEHAKSAGHRLEEYFRRRWATVFEGQPAD